MNDLVNLDNSFYIIALKILVSFIFVTVFPISTVTILYSTMRRVSQVLERYFPRSLQRNNAFLWFSSAISLPWIVSFGGVGVSTSPSDRRHPPTLVHHEYYTVSWQFLAELWKTGLAPGVVGWEWWQLAIWLRCPCFCEDAVILHPFLLFYCNLILLCHLSFFYGWTRDGSLCCGAVRPELDFVVKNK